MIRCLLSCFRFVASGCCLFAVAPLLAAEVPGVPGPFLDADALPWQVNDFPVARWKTLVGGQEGGQIEQPDVQFGLWELAPRATYHGHRHAVPEIYHVLSGRGEWHVDDAVRIVTAGSTIYTRPDAVHRMVNLGDEPLRTVWFWWAPDGRRDVFEGPYEFTEPAPEQPAAARFEADAPHR